MDCVFVSQRPDLPPEHVIDWTKLKTVAQAKAEHDLYVKAQRAREAVVSRYIVTVEGVAFACANDAGWIRSYEEDISQYDHTEMHH